MVHGSIFLLFFFLSDFAQSLGLIIPRGLCVLTLTWSFRLGTSPKFIDREGLGGRRTWTRQDQTVDRLEVKLLQKNSQC